MSNDKNKRRPLTAKLPKHRISDFSAEDLAKMPRVVIDSTIQWPDVPQANQDATSPLLPGQLEFHPTPAGEIS